MRAIDFQEFLDTDPGEHPPRQPTTYAYAQSSQQDPVRRATHPHYNPSAHAPVPPVTYSYSSSSPYPSQVHFTVPVLGSSSTIASTSTGYASTHSSGPPPPSMMQRTTTVPIAGQVNYAQSVPYQNVPLSGISEQLSHPGMLGPGAERRVSESWTYGAYTCIVCLREKLNGDS
jgi:hypothetical protein